MSKTAKNTMTIISTPHNVRHPFLEARAGRPFNNYYKEGPFTVHESNKVNFFLYTVSVTGGIVIYKEASRPSFYDICNALKSAYGSKHISKDLFREYQDKCELHFQEHPELYPKIQLEKSNTKCVPNESAQNAAKNAVKRGRRSR
ncbi:MAG TPA: hypothetical protein VMW50_04745 [Dehalococcoidia bacterium]|nr:hypothetical protein [Dehalococcoidia bacterium]